MKTKTDEEEVPELTPAQRRALEHFPTFPLRQLTSLGRPFALSMQRHGWLIVPKNPEEHCTLTEAGRAALRRTS